MYAGPAAFVHRSVMNGNSPNMSSRATPARPGSVRTADLLARFRIVGASLVGLDESKASQPGDRQRSVHIPFPVDGVETPSRPREPAAVYPFGGASASAGWRRQGGIGRLLEGVGIRGDEGIGSTRSWCPRSI